MRQWSRLESLHDRLEAQIACLAWAFADLRDRPGIVFELGLGHGRTHDHLRRHLADRDIHVFDREIDCYPDCAPEERFMVLGEIAETLPAHARRFAGQVAFAHCDVGSYDADHNARMSVVVSRALRPALARSALVLSDLPLSIPQTMPLPLPDGVRAERYFMYRSQG